MKSCRIVSVIALALSANAATALLNAQAARPADPCDAQVSQDFPQISISNGLVRALIAPPDTQKGYYRSTRFDWSGVIPCLSFKGHTYFNPWRPEHNPLGHDSISGPVEEFKSADGGLGYADAKAGGNFVKPGVGVLRKVDDSPYKFQTLYPIIDSGKWETHAGKSKVDFTHRLNSDIGYGYFYKKTLELEKGKPVLLIHHELKNTGTKAIETDVYDHDFFRLDNLPTGPDTVVQFAFEPKPARPLTNGGTIDGKKLTYASELQERQTVSSPLTGYGTEASDYQFTVENLKSGAGVEQIGDAPISNLVFWSIRNTIAPEAYIRLHIAPGETQKWTIRYRFFAK